MEYHSVSVEHCVVSMEFRSVSTDCHSGLCCIRHGVIVPNLLQPTQEVPVPTHGEGIPQRHEYQKVGIMGASQSLPSTHQH